MKKYRRAYPLFSLCGLNCGLCPRYHTEGGSRCPGCGGMDFELKHPACGVIGCSQKHGGIEYCYQCREYPCPRFRDIGQRDSFISYRKVLSDFCKAETEGMESIQKELEEKMTILQELLSEYNDGRRKSFFCNAVNLLSIEELRSVMEALRSMSSDSAGDVKAKARQASEHLEAKAAQKGMDLKLRK